ncbi:MAG TPA: hypothetical protein VMX75_08950, partial [Spirochaetia bacterium]|nr:hypothetical protein [Spirochaetia bacterium]
MKRILLLPLILSVLSIYFLSADEPPTEPILELTTAMHSSQITRLDSDAEGRYFLTSSYDKTARLWDAETGELIRIFRPPIDSGNEGMLYACALSNDGSLAVVGGWTGWNWEKKHSIYLFSTITGKMIRRIEGMPNVILDLEFSPDGRYLAACLAGENGVRIFETSSWTIKAELTGYGERSNNAAFDGQGRMITASYDGKIRLYGSDFRLIKELKTTGGEQPFSAAFSPDGKKIAVGYDDTTRIQVLDGSNLSLLYEPDVSEVRSGRRLEMVCWSADALFAGATHTLYRDGKWWYQIRRWEDQGRGSYTDLNASQNLVMDIKLLPNGSLIYCGSYPDIGRMDQRGTVIFYNPGEIYDFRSNDRSHFKLSPDGLTVGFTPYSRDALTFSVTDRQFLQEQAPYAPARTEAAGLTVTDWQDSYEPKLNGKKLDFLKRYERSRSADISPDGRRVVFGADWNLYCVDGSGNELWKVATPSAGWAVNIADQAGVVAAGYGDGTVRWYRLEDGAEMLSLFVNSDGKRWVIWTPSGYYD